MDSPGIPNDDPRLRSRAAKHSNERSRLILVVSWLALLYAVALGIAASTDPGALLGLILLGVVVGFWLLMPLWNARLLGRAVKVTPESFPELHAEIVRLQAMLDYRRPIDVYLYGSHEPGGI